jgi:hypothetical protein
VAGDGPLDRFGVAKIILTVHQQGKFEVSRTVRCIVEPSHVLSFLIGNLDSLFIRDLATPSSRFL